MHVLCAYREMRHDIFLAISIIVVLLLAIAFIVATNEMQSSDCCVTEQLKFPSYQRPEDFCRCQIHSKVN